MRFQVAKRDLEAALQVVSSSLSSSGSDMSTHILFRAVPAEKDDGDPGIELLTYSGRVFSSCPVIASVKDAGENDKGAFTVDGKRLKLWLDHVKDAALEFTFDEGEVTAKAPKGRQTFQSLDPSTFPWWDKMLKASKVTATVDANRLAEAISYSRRFISDRESSNPDLCVCEVRDGILYSTDKKAATLIAVAGMAESKMRVHGKDTGGFLSFLASFDQTSVEVLEHDRAIIMRRGDGAIFGESRFQAQFPGLKVQMDEEDQHIWVLPKEDIEGAIGFLTSGAAWEDNQLLFAQGDNGTINLSMMSKTGKTTVLDIKCIESESQDDAPDVPDEGFSLDHFCLTKVLSSWKEDAVRFGINIQGSRGYVRFLDERGGDKFLTIIAWLR